MATLQWLKKESGALEHKRPFSFLSPGALAAKKEAHHRRFYVTILWAVVAVALTTKYIMTGKRNAHTLTLRPPAKLKESGSSRV